MNDDTVDEALAFGEAGVVEGDAEGQAIVRDLHAAGYRVVRVPRLVRALRAPCADPACPSRHVTDNDSDCLLNAAGHPCAINGCTWNAVRDAKWPDSYSRVWLCGYHANMLDAR